VLFRSCRMEVKSKDKVFGGELSVCSHPSTVCGCTMTFAIFLPVQAASGPVPVLYWLSGLTCTEQNFITKAGAFRAAAQHGIAIVCPDTSPRGAAAEDIEGAKDAYDFGIGAGFYVDATQPKWSANWNMRSYVTKELPTLIESQYAVSSDRRGVFGHSMGGHGALTLFFNTPGFYKSVSAFSPICHPTDCAWGIKAFTGYFGDADMDVWKAHDATELVGKYSGPKVEILIDQGTGDSFLKDQLKPQSFEAACKQASYPLTLRMQEGYTHSYYFISTFVEDHIAHHAKFLSA